MAMTPRECALAILTEALDGRAAAAEEVLREIEEVLFPFNDVIGEQLLAMETEFFAHTAPLPPGPFQRAFREGHRGIERDILQVSREGAVIPGMQRLRIRTTVVRLDEP